MKVKTITALSVFATAVIALPTDIKYDAPKGGWESIDYPKGTGEDLKYYPAPKGGWKSVDYPKDAGANLEHYPAPKGGWESVDYTNSKDIKPDDKKKEDPKPEEPRKEKPKKEPKTSTSIYTIHAEPGQVVNGTTPTGGLPGCSGTYILHLNSLTNTICYNITLYSFRGEYSSPAQTATHIHEAAKGASGPPRVVFENPVEIVEGVRESVGCVSGPFSTGVLAAGADTGAGFEVKRIEEAPEGFFVDVHSSLAVPGAVRGQLA